MATEDRKENTGIPTADGKSKSAFSHGKKILIIVLSVVCSIVIFFVGVFGVMELGCLYNRNTLHYWEPDYQQIDITPILEKQTLTDEDYETLYRQTGLTKVGVDDLWGTIAGKNKIRSIQSGFFQKRTIERRKFGPMVYTEEIVYESSSELPIITNLKDGDILVSSSMHFSWWRFGHAGLVIDGNGRRLVEAFEMGYPSDITHASSFAYRANFIVLRPRVDEAVKQQVVEYAKEELVGLSYDFMVGLTSKKYLETPKGTHCSHIVWTAYKQFGVDLDFNGGKVVTPRDMMKSDKMEVVQVFGLNLDELWV